MEKKINKAYFLYGISVIVMVVCFIYLMVNIIRCMKGDVFLSALLMLATWIPCIGMVILGTVVYIWGICCIKKGQTQYGMQKQGKYPWIFGIISNSYMIAFGLVYLCSDFGTFHFYLLTTIVSGVNFVFSILWLRFYNGLFSEEL